MESVEANCMIKDSAELVADVIQIGGGIRQPCFVLLLQHLILPGQHVSRRDLRQFSLLEIGQDLACDHRFFGKPGIQPYKYTPYYNRISER